MNTSSDITGQLTKEIATLARLEPEQIEPNAHFIIDIGMSSLDMLCVLAFAETNFSTHFPDEVISELTTLSKVTEAVRVYRPEQEGGIK